MDVMVNGIPTWISEIGGGFGQFIFENNIFAPPNGSMFILGAGFDALIFRHNTVLYTPNDQWTSVWGREFGQNLANPTSSNYYMQTWWNNAILKYVSDYYFYNNIMMHVGMPWTSGGENINAHMNVYYTPGVGEQTLDNGYTEENLESFATDFVGTDRGQQPDIGAVEGF